MPIVIAAINGKGGAGKTTALMNIAGEYALRGGSVAMIDMDPRNNLMKWWTTATTRTIRPRASRSTAQDGQSDMERSMEKQADGFDLRPDRHAGRRYLHRRSRGRTDRSGDLADPAIKTGSARCHRVLRVRAAHQRGTWAERAGMAC